MQTGSLIPGNACVFVSSFKSSYFISYMRWGSYCMKARTNANCLVRFDSNVNAFSGQLLSILPAWVCVWVCIHAGCYNHEPRQPQVLLENKRRNKCFTKQTYTELPYFFGYQFAASSCIQAPQFLVFSFRWNSFNTVVFFFFGFFFLLVCIFLVVAEQVWRLHPSCTLVPMQVCVWKSI